MADHSARARQLIVGSLRNLLRSLDERVPPADALELLDWFVEVERLAAAGKTIAAGLAAAGEPWRASGDRSAADWLAKRADTTISDARTVLNTAAHLDAAPATAALFRQGELGVQKAEAIATATAAAPDAEADLLHTARHASVKRVRDDAARIRAAADPNPEARHARIHANRTWRRWTDADGARCGTYRLTPETAAILEAAAQPFIDTAIDHARADGRHDSYDALAADGLVAMAQHQLNHNNNNCCDDSDDRGSNDDDHPSNDTDDLHRDGSDDGNSEGSDDGSPGGPGGGKGDGPGGNSPDGDGEDGGGEDSGVKNGGGEDSVDPKTPRPPRGGRGRKRLRARRELIALVDLTALQRGHTHPGETCEIAGIGPIPVSVAQDVFGDALLRIVIRNGTDVTTVVHTGRTASAVQETAVLAQQHGRCGKPFCDRTAVEIDHRDGYTHTGPVTLDQLLGLCGPDHDEKTQHGATWHREPDGTITWTRPDGTQERERPP